jgi:hypothetical protein
MRAMTTQTMTASLIRLLRRKWATPLDALEHCGCLSLAQRVSLDMRHLNVMKQWRKLPNGKRVMAYRVTGAK